MGEGRNDIGGSEFHKTAHAMIVFEPGGKHADSGAADGACKRQYLRNLAVALNSQRNSGTVDSSPATVALSAQPDSPPHFGRPHLARAEALVI